MLISAFHTCFVKFEFYKHTEQLYVTCSDYFTKKNPAISIVIAMNNLGVFKRTRSKAKKISLYPSTPRERVVLKDIYNNLSGLEEQFSVDLGHLKHVSLHTTHTSVTIKICFLCTFIALRFRFRIGFPSLNRHQRESPKSRRRRSTMGVATVIYAIAGNYFIVFLLCSIVQHYVNNMQCITFRCHESFKGSSLCTILWTGMCAVLIVALVFAMWAYWLLVLN